MANHKHLTLEERVTIANLLDKQSSFKAIGVKLDKNCTTISKEIRNHRIIKKTGSYGKAFNDCKKRSHCDHRLLCDNCRRNRFCCTCRTCTTVCPDYVKESCPRLNKPPYVCNGCLKLCSCTLEKWFYQPAQAHDEYRTILSEAREGISLSEDEIKQLDKIVSPLIIKGQSLNHICHNNKDSIMVSESTLYRLVEYNLFTARNIDLPRKVRYSKRASKRNFKIDKKCRIGRTFEDFKTYMSKHPDLPITEIDSIEGKKGGNVLLTVHFVKAEFMIAFHRECNNSKSVIDNFNGLYSTLGRDAFMTIMPVLLADNGSEFSNPSALEKDVTGNQRTMVFYCDPSSPHQKGSAERNHELIRYVIPKGTPLEAYTQEDITLLMSHINSYCRKSLGNKTPYEMMSFLYGEGTPELFGIQKIKPNDVNLTQKLLSKNN